jgi:hypothetical protein
MSATAIFPRLNEPCAFLCTDLSHRESDRRYRIPLNHRPLGAPGEVDEALFGDWPALPTFDQLKDVLRETAGLTFFAPKAWQPEDDSKFATATLGSIILLPPEAWEEEHDDFANWQTDDPDDPTWADVPYTVDDIFIFAKINFSPDCWLTVKRGPLAGQIFHWSHDGDFSLTKPWARDLHQWGERVWAGVPELFGGIIRFDASAADEPAPKNAELYPIKFAT